MQSDQCFKKMRNLIINIQNRTLTDDDIDVLIRKFIKKKSKYARLVEILHRPEDVKVTESDINFLTEKFGWGAGEFEIEVKERAQIVAEKFKEYKRRKRGKI